MLVGYIADRNNKGLKAKGFRCGPELYPTSIGRTGLSSRDRSSKYPLRWDSKKLLFQKRMFGIISSLEDQFGIPCNAEDPSPKDFSTFPSKQSFGTDYNVPIFR